MGWYRATVADNADPESRGRVRLVIPQLFGNNVTSWAMSMDFNVQPEGIPIPGELVWATFEGDDLSYPVYLPSMTRIAFL